MHYELGFYLLAVLSLLLLGAFGLALRGWDQALGLAREALDLLDEELGPDDEQSPSPAV